MIIWLANEYLIFVVTIYSKNPKMNMLLSNNELNYRTLMYFCGIVTVVSSLSGSWRFEFHWLRDVGIE